MIVVFTKVKITRIDVVETVGMKISGDGTTSQYFNVIKS